jgi:hypothetical protein
VAIVGYGGHSPPGQPEGLKHNTNRGRGAYLGVRVNTMSAHNDNTCINCDAELGTDGMCHSCVITVTVDPAILRQFPGIKVTTDDLETGIRS